jgi:transketolase
VYQRDAFINEIIAELESNPRIMFLSADFGAPSLDILRAKFPKNFLHCGISEQAMIDVAAGLALEGKQVFCYAMAPFLSLRALEQVKCGPGLMNLPVVLISVGVGLGYADAGPTHYATEEFACLRAIVGSSVYTAADGTTATRIARDLIDSPRFAYVRLDRDDLPEIGSAFTKESMNAGYRIIGEAGAGKTALVSHGKMTHVCAGIVKESSDRFFAVDVVRAKPFPEALLAQLTSAKGIVAVDEQTPSGALGSAMFEALSAKGSFPRIFQVTLPETYVFENGGREYLLKKFGLSKERVLEAAARIG